MICTVNWFLLAYLRIQATLWLNKTTWHFQAKWNADTTVKGKQSHKETKLFEHI